ncbi:MAG: hypothetical protein R3B49_10515 [Phycisphaerales bacterium]
MLDRIADHPAEASRVSRTKRLEAWGEVVADAAARLACDGRAVVAWCFDYHAGREHRAAGSCGDRPAATDRGRGDRDG